MEANDQVREFLRAAGRKGGQAKSDRKQAASRANGKLSQPAAPSAPPVMLGRPPACVIVRPKAEGQ